MKKLLLFVCIFCSFIATKLNAACQPGQIQVDLTVLSDSYPTETWWEILDGNGTQILMDTFGSLAATQQDYQYCLDANLTCLTFIIHDNYGDGMCCAFGNGYYALSVNGELLIQNGTFTTNEVTQFNCPPGAGCSSATSVQLGNQSASFDNTWYSFTPAESGVYNISTCGFSNTCTSATLWLYDHCAGIVVTEGVQGAVYFSNSGCSSGALINASLIGGQTYYIRVGDGQGNPCGNGAIGWSIGYQGPIVGCTDQFACNFNPLASVSDNSCVYPPSPLCGGPDLEIDSAALISSMALTAYQANAGDCSVTENCVTGYGNRQVITFEMHIRNIGDLDYFIGGTPSDINTESPVFEWAPCHGHWHYKHYGKYTLYDINGNQIPVGLKNGFCVMDLECGGGGTPQYGCGNMGISAGCGDIYGAGTTCQWIDVTDVDTGIYVFQADVNWLMAPDALGHYEQGYGNNMVRACFKLNRDGSGTPSIQILSNCTPWTDCTGQLLGNARQDCAGNCNGYALQGDLNADTLHTMEQDVVDYVSDVQTLTIPPTPCTDLNDDNGINIVDAALLQQCVRHQNDEGYWGAQIPCLFPAGRFNPNQIGVMTIGASGDGFVDVYLNCPLSKIMAFQFQLSGILGVDSVKTLVPGFNPVIRFGLGGISGIDTTEGVTPKFYLPSPFMRVYFQSLPSTQVCIAQIDALVNETYETIDHQIANGCIDISAGLTERKFTKFLASIPNPFTNNTTIYFPNPLNLNCQSKLVDMMGKVVRTNKASNGTELEINREGLLPGIYTVVIECGNEKYLARIVAI